MQEKSNFSILHITGDYPDGFNPNKTHVIKRLVDGLEEYGTHQKIISLNRVSKFASAGVNLDGNVLVLNYYALPYGVLQRFFIWYAVILNKIILSNFVSDVSCVYLHKLTIEFFFFKFIFEKSDVPYIISIQGNTDRKIVRAKPWLYFIYRKALENSKCIVFCTPWAKSWFENYFSLQNLPIKVIPFISFVKPREYRSPKRECSKFVLAFNFQSLKCKNVNNLLASFRVLIHSGYDVYLDIYGWGEPYYVNLLSNMIKKYQLEDVVKLCGKVQNSEIVDKFSNYHAFLMPSEPESFGLVYIEALAARIPVMCSINNGIDGFFENYFPGVVVDPKSLSSICKGIINLIEDVDRYDANVDRSLNNFKEFDTEHIINEHLHILRSCAV